MSTVFIQANTNGRLHPAAEASLSPLNRGYLYGDAIYEVWRTYDGVLFAWEEHWKRLRESAAALHLDVPFEPGRILGEIARTAAAHRAACGYTGQLYVRLQISRGGGPIGLDIALADRPDFVLLVQPCPDLSAEKARSGLKLSLARDMRRNPAEALNPAWKTGNYLNNLLCLREARARGADEVVILNLAGEVTEAAVSNVAFVRGGTMATPPLQAGILSGITRSLVLSSVAARAGLAAEERALGEKDFASMSECFLMSTTKDIVPVASIDEHRFEVGPDTATMRLKEAFGRYARQYAQEHGDLRLF
ncbi:MAG: aminotransferase class IV [Opitutaceae bacterium]|jgi:branched-chain amino acid aminotransferase